MAKFKIILISLFLCGCAGVQISTPKAVVLQKDMVYTVPAGKPVNLMLDKKPITVTFAEDMKVTSIDYLLSQERKLNDAVLDKARADTNRNKWIAIFGSIFAAIAGGIGIFFKMKTGNINLKGELKS